MRFRDVFVGALGLALIVFAISAWIYKWIFKKEKRFNERAFLIIQIAMILIGGVMLYTPTMDFVHLKKGKVSSDFMVEYNGKTIKTIANADDRLQLHSVYDSIEATHPSVVSLEKPINGYRYYMAVTPYPKGQAIMENPHVFMSNDLITWDANTNNPFDEPKSEAFNGNIPLQYNSDTHIIFNEEDNRLEMYWRYVDDIEKTMTIFRRTSKDGEKWTEKEIAFKGKKPEEDWLSPAFIKDENGYKVWYVANGYRIWYRESEDGFKWSDPKEVVVPYDSKDAEDMKHWHLDVQATDLGYEMLVVGFKSTGTNQPSERHTMNLYYSQSDDNTNWSALTPIIFPSQRKNDFDGKGLYRSALLKENGQYYVFYSGIGYDDTRGVSISYGPDINNLKGLKLSDYSDVISE